MSMEQKMCEENFLLCSFCAEDDCEMVQVGLEGLS